MIQITRLYVPTWYVYTRARTHTHTHSNSLVGAEDTDICRHTSCFGTNCMKNFMEQSPLQKPIFAQLVKKFPVFYVTRRLITVFTRVRHWSLSPAILIRSIISTQFPRDSLKHHRPIYVEVFSLPSGLPIIIFWCFSCMLHARLSSSLTRSPNNIWRRVQVMKIFVI